MNYKSQDLIRATAFLRWSQFRTLKIYFLLCFF